MVKHKNKKQRASGYYLALDNCPPGGLSTVKGYDDCCPPIFSGSLSGSSQSYNWNPECGNPIQIGHSRNPKFRKSSSLQKTKKYNKYKSKIKSQKKKFKQKKKNYKLTSKNKKKKKYNKSISSHVHFARRFF